MMRKVRVLMLYVLVNLYKYDCDPFLSSESVGAP